jgi:type IX secretion system PorP/SprF family membrane protein
MKKLVIYFLCFSSLYFPAQQTTSYVQYVFNKAGVNPAASGTNIQQEYFYACGLNRQWLGFANAPKQHFVNFSYTLKPTRSYRYWQSFGIYAENDDSGLLAFAGAYGNYAVHFLVRKKTVLSFGVYAGARRFMRNIAGFDRNDPVMQNSQAAVLVYPDIIPGIRIENQKFFFDLAARQLTIIKMDDYFSSRRIGQNSRLLPVIFADIGKRIPVNDLLVMMPSAAVNFPILNIPSFDFTLMFYYFSRIGIGAALRNTSFASGILQVRFLKNFTAGFAYSYPINKMRYAAPHSIEFMIGITPFGMTEKFVGTHSVSRCPSLSY